MVIASSHVFVFSFWWKVPKGYMALELFFVSARTIKRHHHHHHRSVSGRGRGRRREGGTDDMGNKRSRERCVRLFMR